MPTSMQSCKHAGVTARQPSLPVRRSRTCTITRAVEQIVREAETTTSTDSKAEIYIGFPKNDTGSREGRKGRVVIDDPAKYPGKDDIGFLAGATGGWAGGEAALVKLRESIKEEMKASKVEAAKPSSSKKVSGSKQPGAQPIYVGYGKDELELRKSGEKGRVIYDDATKYPGKEDVGPLAGATGGFAGGERGVKAFVATGEVKLRKAGEPGGQPISPLTTAFLVLVAGAGSAAVVSQVSSGQEVALPTLDGLTLNMAIGALALLTVGAVGAGARNAASSLQSQVEQVQETASKVVITGAFLVAVFFAARAVLEI